MFVPRNPPFTEAEARAAIAASVCWRDALLKLGYKPNGHNPRTLQRYVRRWGISTDHFDPHIGRRRAGLSRTPSLESVMVEGSNYPRGRLKERLYQSGLKVRRCELCGQGEEWRGRRMALILDHVNGVGDDNRLENLRIVCPNCAATLDTHCGRNLPRERRCPGCGETFEPRHARHRYCSQRCWGIVRHNPSFGGPGASFGIPRPEARRVDRPPYGQLMREIDQSGYSAVGRRYGVSDNAVRKWVRMYERQHERAVAIRATARSH
jgi:hypothetical protein